jgi:signal transduction histidine kinase
MLNLILNAIEAMSGSSDTTRELLIRTEQDGPDGVLVAVEDSGPGLEPDSLYRLSICRSIVAAHGRRMWATPNLPHGAASKFTLPQQRETVS